MQLVIPVPLSIALLYRDAPISILSFYTRTLIYFYNASFSILLILLCCARKIATSPKNNEKIQVKGSVSASARKTFRPSYLGL